MSIQMPARMKVKEDEEPGREDEEETERVTVGIKTLPFYLSETASFWIDCRRSDCQTSDVTIFKYKLKRINPYKSNCLRLIHQFYIFTLNDPFKVT